MIIDVQFLLGSARSDPISKAVVTKVHDGDTPSTQEGSIRLLGIDAPELKQLPWGSMARTWLTKRVLGKPVELLLDTHAPDRDKYGRLLRWLRVEDSILNVEIVKEGLALKYIKGNLDYIPELELAEGIAKQYRKCVWGDPNFVIPSEYRKYL